LSEDKTSGLAAAKRNAYEVALAVVEAVRQEVSK
jgi:chromosome partitioning protein